MVNRIVEIPLDRYGKTKSRCTSALGDLKIDGEGMKVTVVDSFELPDTRSERDIDDKNGIWLVRIRSEPPRSRVIVFVHGLRGHATKTWSQFAQLLAPRINGYDLAFYGYETPILSALIPLMRRPPIPSYAQLLRRSLWESLVVDRGYEEIVLVCHSLGGIVVKAAVQQIEDIDVNRDEYLKRLHSIFFFGTPHFGSHRLNMFVARLSPVLSALRANAKELERVRDFWRYRVSLHPDDRRPRRIFLHARAIYSDKDFWLDSESGLGEIDQADAYPHRVSHSRLVSPAHEGEGHFVYFGRQLEQIQEMRDAGVKFPLVGGG